MSMGNPQTHTANVYQNDSIKQVRKPYLISFP